jgi:hypothetical protein
LCFGRYDTGEHSLSDEKLPVTWPGRDYNNPMVRATTNAERPWEDTFDRLKYPRMPWHDIQV